MLLTRLYVCDFRLLESAWDQEEKSKLYYKQFQFRNNRNNLKHSRKIYNAEIKFQKFVIGLEKTNQTNNMEKLHN